MNHGIDAYPNLRPSSSSSIRLDAGFSGGLAAVGNAFGSPLEFYSNAESATAPTESAALPMARYPQKTELILLTDRPPQLETPLSYFQTDLTPNDAFFVRWHLSGIPTIG